MALTKTGPNKGVRERILAAADELFSRDEMHRVSVGAIVARAGCARASVYNIFGSKDGLIEAYLKRRAELRSGVVLENEMIMRADDADGRLLAIFDILDDWFNTDGVRHRTLVELLLDAEPETGIHKAVAAQLATVRSMIDRHAQNAGLENTEEFARIWHMLMKGAIVTRKEGDHTAARAARRGGEIILNSWRLAPPVA